MQRVTVGGVMEAESDAWQAPAYEPPSRDGAAYPAAALWLVSSLDAGVPRDVERRRWPRGAYRVIATFRAGGPRRDVPTVMLYTRDVNEWGVRFCCQAPLPQMRGATVTLVAPDGGPLSARCQVLRCRRVMPAWFEGGLRFERRQARFALDAWTVPPREDRADAEASWPRRRRHAHDDRWDGLS